ncbi:VanW family protein [Candidatus Kuenenbacteria bacterium]|nr:VanW family protein [Candidatus Kuenenbacteria bacterium]
MEGIIKKPKKKIIKWLIISLSIFFIIIIVLAGTSVALAYKYENKIYSGIKIDSVNVGGLTQTQAISIINGKFKQTYDDGFNFVFDNTEKKIINEDNKFLSLNLDSMVENAFNQGHSNNWFKKHLKVLVFPIIKKQLDLDYQLDKNLLKEQLKSEFTILENPAKDTEINLQIPGTEGKKYELDFSASKVGHTFNFNEAIDSLEKGIQKFNNPKVELIKSTDYPKITVEQALTQKDLIDELLKIEQVDFAFKNKTWTVEWEDFSHWLKLDLNENEEITVSLNPEMVKGQLEAIGQETNQEATDAKLQMKNGRVTEFQASQNGQELDMEKNLQKTITEIITNKNNKIALTVNITEPKVTVGSTNELGIKELIGYGLSDYSGSPSNRRHNIGIGAAALNGVLIAPGGEFSLVETLGDIDASSGYKPELVIKKNETIPEYGGGLCQIGTTIFRAALQSALQITVRRNHSYRVGYYEPAGTDATIYDPWPDFKFLNDTEHHILIQSKLWGNTVMFEIWGTDDGRKVSFEGQTTVSDVKYLKPTIFNITSPGPAKEIETEELEPGVKKRTEYAHNGADTVFYQYITKPGEETEKITWSSHYVPWQEVFLVGVDPEKKAQEAKEIEEAKEAETLAGITEEETTIEDEEEKTEE